MKRLLVGFLFLSNIFFAEAQDSLVQQNFPLRFSAQQLIAPVALFANGLLVNGSTKFELAKWRNEQLPNFHTRIDDVLSVSPIVIAYGLDAFGLASKNDFWNRSAMLFKGELMMLGTVYVLKYTTKELRPDASDNHSFPSNHSAQAFLAATFISQEYKDKLPWLPYAAYTVAGSVAALRIANNSHYLSDVLVGAGIGILAQKVAYWTHQYRWGRKASKPILKF
jgi:membrane-associated phospholipid phosphatase